MFVSTSRLASLLPAVLLAEAAAVGGGSCPITLQKDVVVVGGGASGSHAAFRLKEDFGKSVALIEMQDVLGGAVDSYDDPNTGLAVNYGVQTFVNKGNSTTGFFESIGVPYSVATQTASTSRYVDFTTGRAFNYSSPTFAEELVALQKYVDIVSPWTDFLQPGYFDFPAPQDIPEDLLLPFGQFVKKHGLEDMLGLVFQTTAYGLGDITNQITLYTIQAFGADLASVFLGTVVQFQPTSGRNQDIYDAVADKLGSDVFYSSTVIETKRNDNGVTLKVKNSKTGKITRIKAKKLLITIPPTADNMATMDLDAEEKALFAKIEFSRLYPALVTNAALPDDYTITNLPLAAASDVYALPQRPFVINYKWFAENLFHTVAVGDEAFTQEQGLQLIQQDFTRLVHNGVFSGATTTNLDFVVYANHGAMHSRVSAADLKAGFIQKQYELLGKRSTWWSGATFSAQLSTILWEFNDVLLPKLVASM